MHQNHTSKLVALVDDDFAYRSMIEDYLLFQGLNVVSFGDPESFLGSFLGSGARFAVVISDINMPKISGLELLREVRTMAPNVQVILMTAAPNGQDEETSRNLGAKCYLTKPCRLTEVFEQVQAALVAGRP